MKILITGGAGFLGANLVKTLIDENHKVDIYDNYVREGSRQNAEWLRKKVEQKNVISIKPEDVEGYDLIFHLAGQTTVTESVKNPMYDFMNNAYATVAILEAIRKSTSKPALIFSSTNKVYGKVPEKPIGENQPLDFQSPYGCSKGSADQYVLDYARIYGLRTAVLRQSCIYGPRQFGIEGQGWISWFVQKILKEEQITIFGNGEQVRDILHVKDWVEIAIKVAERVMARTNKYNVYNVGGGNLNTLSLLEAVELIQDLTGQKANLIYSEARKGDQPTYISNITRAQMEYLWKPKINPQEGILDLINWTKEII